MDERRDEWPGWIANVRRCMLDERDESIKFEPFFKVPAFLRLGNEGEYDHIFLTIGPYHAKFSSPFSPCDQFKLQAARALTSTESFSSLVAKIYKRVPEIRDLYSEPWAHSQEELPGADFLAHLLALDALTVIAVACYEEVFRTANATIMVASRDAFLLEHQLPLFLLQYAIDSCSVHFRTSLEKVVKMYAFSFSFPFQNNGVSKAAAWDPPTTLNQSMISYIYHSLITCDTKSSSPRVRIYMVKPLPTASQIRKCGISFAACPGGFRAISFDKRSGVLSLPQITVFDTTPSYLLNLYAYEAASRYIGPCPVASYIVMMTCLINVEEDVTLLVESGVIQSQVARPSEVASMWNKMSVHLPSILTEEDADVVTRVNAVCKIKWRKQMAAFRDTYCEKQPWLLISIVAAFILFALTSLQTIYTIMQYYHT